MTIKNTVKQNQKSAVCCSLSQGSTNIHVLRELHNYRKKKMTTGSRRTLCLWRKNIYTHSTSLISISVEVFPQSDET